MEYFIADTHAFHKNIAGPIVSDWDKGYRTYADEFVMTKHIADVINSHVDENDTLYHLGDWSFGGKERVLEFRNMVRCRNIILIYGNHDDNIRKYYRHLFTETHSFLERRINKQFIVMSHYAMRVWQKSHHGSWCLYGHSHGSLEDIGGKTIDIGWDVWKKPLSFNEVREIMASRPINFVDHHNEETAQ